jgi:hypothetical protein
METTIKSFLDSERKITVKSSPSSIRLMIHDTNAMRHIDLTHGECRLLRGVIQDHLTDERIKLESGVY